MIYTRKESDPDIVKLVDERVEVRFDTKRMPMNLQNEFKGIVLRILMTAEQHHSQFINSYYASNGVVPDNQTQAYALAQLFRNMLVECEDNVNEGIITRQNFVASWDMTLDVLEHARSSSEANFYYMILSKFQSAWRQNT